MGVSVKLKNWNGIGRMFEFEIPEMLDESINHAIDEATKVYSESILDTLAEQPGEWTPKSEGWADRSGSSDLFFGETGQFVMSVASPGANQRGIKAKRGNKRVFVGARYDVMHHSGFSMATLAEILQATPDYSRDLFGKAYDRVEEQLNSIYRSVGINLL